MKTVIRKYDNHSDTRGLCLQEISPGIIQATELGEFGYLSMINNVELCRDKNDAFAIIRFLQDYVEKLTDRE